MMERPPAKFLHELQPGEQWCVYSGGHMPALVVIHPDRAPKMIFEDGVVVEIKDVTR